jgi:hypothetical protein
LKTTNFTLRLFSCFSNLTALLSFQSNWASVCLPADLWRQLSQDTHPSHGPAQKGGLPGWLVFPVRSDRLSRSCPSGLTGCPQVHRESGSRNDRGPPVRAIGSPRTAVQPRQGIRSLLPTSPPKAMGTRPLPQRLNATLLLASFPHTHIGPPCGDSFRDTLGRKRKTKNEGAGTRWCRGGETEVPVALATSTEGSGSRQGGRGCE